MKFLNNSSGKHIYVCVKYRSDVMHKWKVLVTARSFAQSDPAPQKMLEDAGCDVFRPEPGVELSESLKDVDAVIAGLESYTKDTLSAAQSLKIISRYGVGYDAIDLAAAKEANIAVANTPGANSESVADLAFALMLSAARHIPQMDSAIKAGGNSRPLGMEMWKKTLGIIGMGKIGKGVVERASGFRMRILCLDIFKDEVFAKKFKAHYTDLDTLLHESDFITIHVPLSIETRNMIDSTALSKMKKKAVLVNTARGGIIDEEALVKALSNGTIGACGLDVTTGELNGNNLLCKLPNCILSSHAGAATHEAVLNMGTMAAKNLLDYLETGTCTNLVY